MFALRNWVGVAVVAAVCGFGSEARAQTGKVYGVNDGTGVAGGQVGTFTMYSGTARIITTNYAIDVYPSATMVGGKTITTFVMRDAKSFNPIYGGECEVFLAPGGAGLDIRIRTTKQYFGNQLAGYETRDIAPSTWSRYRLAP